MTLPHSGTASAETGGRHLALRIGSSLVLAALAVAIAILGGPVFVLFWAVASIIILWEWTAITAAGRGARAAGAFALICAGAACLVGQLLIAAMVALLGAVAAAVLAAAGRRAWAAGGVFYAEVALLAPVVLRRDPENGVAAMLFLFAIVWSTDIFGFFVGRIVGGPKLAPRISPNKTLAGAAAGTAGAIALGVAVLFAAGQRGILPGAALAGLLAIVSQVGDLFESSVKRRFGVKDAGQIIPGHGGLMDRLDGFLAAAGVAALVGLARGGADAPGRGLLWW